MRTRKKELISDELKPFVGKLIKENRQKYNYSLEDLSAALNHQKNRQTLHKYESGLLNIPLPLLLNKIRHTNIVIATIEIITNFFCIEFNLTFFINILLLYIYYNLKLFKVQLSYQQNHCFQW